MRSKRSIRQRRRRGGRGEDTSRKLEARSACLATAISNLLAELGPEDDDDRRIFELLGGRICFKKLNRPGIEYLRGDQEHAARRVLAKRLRGDQPLSQDLRDLLAALFDPDPPGSWVERQLEFRFRTGRKREFHRDVIINLLMAIQVGAGIPVQTASDRVARAFGMTSDAVRKVWERQQIT